MTWMHVSFEADDRWLPATDGRLAAASVRPTLFVPPEEEEGRKYREGLTPVVGFASYGSSAEPIVAVGHADGVIHNYHARTGACL
jgi:hypothetical protein